MRLKGWVNGDVNEAIIPDTVNDCDEDWRLNHVNLSSEIALELI